MSGKINDPVSRERLEIMDTTLRDGEQTSGMSLSPREKLSIAQMLLDELKADRIEVASARVSEGEYDAVHRIMAWTAEKGAASGTDILSRIEILGFVDGGGESRLDRLGRRQSY